ncbi:MAG: hypothetical protein SNI49_03310 [Rikenellaceae bacterium]
METTKEPIVTFYAPALDIELIKQLSKYWIVIVEEQAVDKIKVELYLREVKR